MTTGLSYSGIVPGTVSYVNQIATMAVVDPTNSDFLTILPQAITYAENRMYYGKDNGDGVVTAPLHDRNGETIGVAKFFLKSFPGQTAANSIGRVVPTLQEIEKQVGSADDLAEE